MPVVTPPFDSRRISQQVVAAGPAASGAFEVLGVRPGDRLASVIAFTGGVPDDVSSGFTITAADEVTYDDTDHGDLSTAALVLLLVAKAHRSAAVGEFPTTGLVVSILTGVAGFPDTQLPLPGAFPGLTDIYAIISSSVGDLHDATGTFVPGDSGEPGLDGFLFQDGGVDEEGQKLVVIWSPDSSITFDGGGLGRVRRVAGTGSGVDLSVSGVTGSTPIADIWSWTTGSQPVTRTSEYAAGTDILDKAAGTSETGKFIWAWLVDPDALRLTVALGGSTQETDTTVAGMTPGATLHTVIGVGDDGEVVDPLIDYYSPGVGVIVKADQADPNTLIVVWTPEP